MISGEARAGGTGDGTMTTEYGEDHLDFRGGTFGSSPGRRGGNQATGPAPPPLNALPAKVVGFSGRADELRALLNALNPTASGESDSPPDTPTAVPGSGRGGVRVRRLRQNVARGGGGNRGRREGRVPGGTLFVDLHGYDDNPVTADQALQAFLRALGIEPEHIPATADERAALYRSTLAQRAEQCGPVLILADNASSTAQVRPLLPGTTHSTASLSPRVTCCPNSAPDSCGCTS